MKQEKTFMNNKKNRTEKLSSSGFTLVEMTIVILISSIVLITVMEAVKTWMDKIVAIENQQRLNAIQLALTNYQTQNNRLPCPASFIVATGAANFGREIVKGGCPLTYTPDGTNTVAATGRTGSTDAFGSSKVTSPPIIIGALPVRDLGLPDSYIADSYGYRYTYAITQSETTAPLNGFAGAINVVDNTGATVLPLAGDGTSGTATYVLVDHGKDGKGAYYDGATTTAVSCGSAAGWDNDNCNHYASGYFRSAAFSNQSGTSHFDDMVAFNTSLSTSTNICQTVYNAPVSATASGTSTGHYQSGLDYGWGFDVGAVVVYVGTFPNGYFFSDYPNAGMNATSPIVVASCGGNSHVIAGGCTQTLGPPTPPAGPHFTNLYTADYEYTPSSIFPPFNYNQQLVQPPLSHPVYSNTGAQGWECDGSSANGIYTQAYAVCCTGGG